MTGCSSDRPIRSPQPVLDSIVAGVLALVLAAVPLRAQCPDGTPPPCRGGAPTRPPSGSIAVFPFVNRSPDSTDAYLAEALPEQIIGRLARVAELRIKSATVVNAQWRRTPDPMSAARALRVEWFVSGSVRRAGRQLAVSAELVRSTTGDGAWSAPFHRGDDDLAAVEEQIAESVAVAIIGRLATSQVSQLRRTPSRNPEAYRLYLYGRTLTRRRTAADIAAAQGAFESAIRLDSGFAAAWAQLGWIRSLQVQYGSPEGLAPDSLLVLAGSAVDRALALDSGSAEGWAARGVRAFLAGDLDAAHAALIRALRLDSLNADIAFNNGYPYSVDLLELPEVGEPYFRRALALDPDYRNAFRHLALLRLSRGQAAEAEALFDSALTRGPWVLAFRDRSLARFVRGDGVGALADLAEAERLGGLPRFPGGPFGVWDLEHALYPTAVGDSAPSRALLARLDAAADRGLADLSRLALVRVVLGQRSAALDALEQLRARPDSVVARCGPAPCSTGLTTWRLLHNPLFAPLQPDARFQRLLADTRPRVPWVDRP
jgi:TolB-like protein/lipoprotein NlpI